MGRLLALLCAVLSLSALTAGCVAQDRPEEARIFAVADAGPDRVLPQDSAAAFEWNETHGVEVDGHPPETPEARVGWESVGCLGQASANASHFSCSAGGPTLALVVVSATVETATASDAAAVLFVPPSVDPGHNIFVATRGQVALVESGGRPAVASVTVGVHRGTFVPGGLGFPSAAFAEVPLSVEPSLSGPSTGSILLGVKAGRGAAVTTATQLLDFEPGSEYTLLIDTTPAAAHRMVVREGGAERENVTLSAFAAAHLASETAVKVEVVHSQGLPGPEGPAAAAAFACVALLVGRRRRAQAA